MNLNTASTAELGNCLYSERKKEREMKLGELNPKALNLDTKANI